MKETKTKRNFYFCSNCGKTALISKDASFCPFCGSSEIARDCTKAKNHALEVIEEMKSLLPSIEKAWDEYLALFIEFENRRRVVSDYARNGIIDKSIIPVLKKKQVVDALYEYRKKRKSDGQN